MNCVKWGDIMKLYIRFLLAIINRGFWRILGDEYFLRLKFYILMGRPLNLTNPQTFNEKLQWLKLHDRKPEYTTMVDKYAVRGYIAEKLGEEYLIPLLGVWDDPEEIDFDKLPDRFVLKCTHDSGGVVICRDKSQLNSIQVKKKLKKNLKRNFYSITREWPYKNVPRKIIAEKYMTDESGVTELTDYKFFCFDGYVDCVMVCLERTVNDAKYYFFDRQWNLKRLNKRGQAAPENFTINKPEHMDAMFTVAEKLSRGLPFVRVDLYQSEGKIYFGELTFFPASGFDANLLKETDKYFGRLIKEREYGGIR